MRALTWVGPPPEALRRGGDKLEAKRIADAAGVPTLPTGDPEELGYPLLVKAAAGGGGRGMRVVRDASELVEAMEAAAREAEAAFGDGTVYCERFLPRPRHVEVQLMGDRHGNVVALGERDCSVQRRHQKVIEESPPPRLPAGVRALLARHAVAFGEAIGYESAGTAEFLVDGDDVFFLELNGRIQVEHPVTEAVTQLDVVELQLMRRRRRLAGRSRDRVPRARRRGAPLRRGSAHVPAATRCRHEAAPPEDDPRRRGHLRRRRDRRRLRPDDREARRARHRPRRRARPARRRARGDGRRGSDRRTCPSSAGSSRIPPSATPTSRPTS